MTEAPPRRVPWEALDWLPAEVPIPECERHQWIMAPADMSYVEASRWADRWGFVELLHLASGETLLRLRRG